jgi:hypothetical protein
MNNGDITTLKVKKQLRDTIKIEAIKHKKLLQDFTDELLRSGLDLIKED